MYAFIFVCLSTSLSTTNSILFHIFRDVVKKHKFALDTEVLVLNGSFWSCSACCCRERLSSSFCRCESGSILYLFRSSLLSPNQIIKYYFINAQMTSNILLMSPLIVSRMVSYISLKCFPKRPRAFS